MASVKHIPSKNITQFEAKQVPTIEQENKIFKKDNIGTVVPGDALRNINLSTIPDIIQDAINKAILDAKTQTLADSLISTMRQTIENFEDGIYTKSYIDTTISYLEELLTQKVSPEIVASIAEAKIAVATSELATTSQVGIISSRLENSETEIINIKETINTKDTARATQIEELQASINQNLSNYSDVIELYIDADGNIRSQKIENLEAKNSLKKVSITELNQVVLDEAGNYSAIVANAILDSDGKIVGFTFSDTNELTTFTINADVFKVSNSTNTRTPFRIENNELYFDGKVTFSNITDKTSVVTMQNVEDAIRDNVTTIDGGKIATASIVSHQIEANAIAGKNITGGTIRGTQIIGSVIKGSFIDLTTTLALTNWQYFTPSNVPSEYEANFAHHNTGEITVDSEGYVRLPGQQNFIIPSLVQSGTLYNGSLSNVTTTRSVTINKIWDLYSWDSYNVNTLQRPIRNNTQFSSNSLLIFKGSISCESPFGGSGTDVNNYGTYSFRFLNTDIVVSIQASNGNQHNAEITNVIFNGSTVAYADGRYGESTGSDSAFIDYSTTIKGVPINIKTEFYGTASYNFVFTATINNNTIITNHTLGDVIKINSVSHSFNTANSSVAGQTTATYEINFPSTWVV